VVVVYAAIICLVVHAVAALPVVHIHLLFGDIVQAASVSASSHMLFMQKPCGCCSYTPAFWLYCSRSFYFC
jgi:hypothetical protein